VRAIPLGILCVLAAVTAPAAARAQELTDSERRELSSQLILHVASGDKAKVISLLDEGADPEARGPGGMTVLMSALFGGKLEVAKLLLEGRRDIDGILRRSSIETRDDQARTALMYAVDGGSAGAVDLCLAKGGDLDAQDREGVSALMRAADDRRVALAGALLARKAKLDLCDQLGQTALLRAVKKDQAEATKLLLEAGADPNVTAKAGENALGYVLQFKKRPKVYPLVLGARTLDPNTRSGDLRRTPLMVASVNGDLEAQEDLLKRGADPNLEDAGGCTALALAIKSFQKTAAFRLLRVPAIKVDRPDQEGTTPLVKAALIAQTDLMASLCARGANVNARDGNERTVLMRAIEDDQVESVRFLLDHGAELETRDDSGMTAVMWSAACGSPELVLLLLKRGAVVDAQTTRGKTALMFAAMESNWPEVVQHLLDHGADPLRHDQFGVSAIFYASMGGRLDVVKKLARLGASLRETSTYNETLLTCAGVAMESDNPELVRYLVAEGLDVNAADNGGETALMGAAKSGNLASFEALLALGADLGKRDNDGEGVLAYAADRGQRKMAALILEKGIPVDTRGQRQTTALMVAAKSGHLATVSLLCDRGADVLARDELARTALDHAKAAHQEEVVAFLAERMQKREKAPVREEQPSK
jgi:ankyrin repeat protein